MNTNDYAGQIKAGIRNFILKELLFETQVLPIDDASSFLAAGIIDSMGVMELINYVEKEHGIKVEPEDMMPENFDSVNALAKYIFDKSNIAAMPV